MQRWKNCSPNGRYDSSKPPYNFDTMQGIRDKQRLGAPSSIQSYTCLSTSGLCVTVLPVSKQVKVQRSLLVSGVSLSLKMTWMIVFSYFQ